MKSFRSTITLRTAQLNSYKNIRLKSLNNKSQDAERLFASPQSRLRTQTYYFLVQTETKILKTSPSLSVKWTKDLIW